MEIKKKIRIILFVFLTIISHADEKEDSSSYISCNVMGQLGNQLFQIATTLAYAWDYNAFPIFPELNYQGWNRPYNRDHIFFRLAIPSTFPPHMFRVEEQYIGSTEQIPYQPNMVLDGYFQYWKRFHHHRDSLLEILKPSSFYLTEIQQKYGDLLSHPKTVSIHVRTSCKRKHVEEGFHFIGMNYYQQAAKLFPDDSLFVVFSDRIDWCKHHFEFCKNVVFIEGNDHIMDLFLMSMMKHHIIGNSTFSWWGAYLNTNPEKTVVAPYPWNHLYSEPFPAHKKEFFPPDWIILSIEKEADYPEDMYIYSPNSLSVDCN